jgi:3-oxoacyl-[acyl-carrier protein] reductase
LGRHIAKRFVQEGCNLFLTGRTEQKLDSLRKELLNLNGHTKIYCENGNLENIRHVHKIIGKCREKLKSVDILINNAGVFDTKSIENSSTDFLDLSFNINVRAPFIFCKEFCGDMVNKKWGRIINVGSVASYRGFSNNSVYCLTKHALLGLSRSLFLELKNNNVRVFLIAPHTIISRMGKIVERNTDEKMSDFINPEEVVEYIVFAIKFDNQMISEEVRLNRISYNEQF